MLGDKKRKLATFWPFCMLGKNERKRKTAKSRSLQNLNLSPTISAKKNYSRNRQALAAPVTTASAYRNLKVTALKLHIYILLSHESKRKQMTANNKNKPWWDLRTPFFAVESFSCMSSASLLTLNLKSLFKEKQLPTASRAPSVGTWTSAQD